MLRGVSFAVHKNERIGVVGPSGGGKSVLLKIIGKVLDPDSGKIIFDHEQESAVDDEPSVGFLFQEGALFDSMTVLENVTFPMRTTGDADRSRGFALNRKEARLEAYQRAMQILKAIGLGKHGHKLPGQLSGGMRKRLALARALVTRPGLALLDDPTAGLDPVAASVIMNLILKLQATIGSTIILVSQEATSECRSSDSTLRWSGRLRWQNA